MQDMGVPYMAIEDYYKNNKKIAKTLKSNFDTEKEKHYPQKSDKTKDKQKAQLSTSMEAVKLFSVGEMLRIQNTSSSTTSSFTPEKFWTSLFRMIALQMPM